MMRPDPLRSDTPRHTRAPLRRSAVGLGALLLILAAATAACDSGRIGGPGTADAELLLRADVAGSAISTLVATVSAPDIPTNLVYNLVLVDGIASATLKVPPGSNRTITIEAFASDGTITHVGSVTINVRPGINPPVAIVLSALAGQVPITVSIASFSVAISPSTLELLTGETAQLTAVVQSASGLPVTGVVQWASTNPAIATVDDTGLVTALRSGNAMIVANYEGVAGSTAVQVAAADPTGTYQGTADVAVTGTVLAIYSNLLIAGIFGCTLPCPATVELAGTGSPDVVDFAFSTGNVSLASDATLAGTALTPQIMQFSAQITVTSTNTLTCTSTATPLTFDPFGGPRINGPVPFNCSMTDVLLGTISGVVTVTLDVTRL